MKPLTGAPRTLGFLAVVAVIAIGCLELVLVVATTWGDTLAWAQAGLAISALAAMATAVIAGAAVIDVGERARFLLLPLTCVGLSAVFVAAIFVA